MFRNRRIRRSVASVLLPIMALLPVLPGLAQAQYGGEMDDACQQGLRDARMQVSGTWFFAGCFGLAGLLVAFLVEPNPPMMAVMGKPPEWVVFYSDCYGRAGKSAQGKKALGGCAVVAGAYAILYILLIAAANDAANDPYSY